jgi:Ca-activated chloride channel homolog
MSLEWNNGIWLLAAAALLILVPSIGWWLESRYRNISRDFSTTHLGQGKVSRTIRRWKWILIGLTLASLALALADPRYGVEVREVSKKGRDVIFVLDVSKSMLAKDVTPTRLKRAKADIIDGVRDMAGHRLGLVIFAGQPKEISPLTYDHSHFIRRLREVDPSSVPMGGTNIGDALRMALDAIDAGASLGHHRDIILITDGQDLTGYYEEVSKKAGSKKVSIYTVGIGQTTPTGIRMTDGTYLKSEGEVVKTALNPESLKEISIMSGGFFQNLLTSPHWLGNILKVVDAKEQKHQSSFQNQHKVPRYPGFVLLSMLLWSLAILIPDRKRKTT